MPVVKTIIYIRICRAYVFSRNSISLKNAFLLQYQCSPRIILSSHLNSLSSLTINIVAVTFCCSFVGDNSFRRTWKSISQLFASFHSLFDFPFFHSCFTFQWAYSAFSLPSSPNLFILFSFTLPHLLYALSPYPFISSSLPFIVAFHSSLSPSLNLFCSLSSSFFSLCSTCFRHYFLPLSPHYFFPLFNFLSFSLFTSLDLSKNIYLPYTSVSSASLRTICSLYRIFKLYIF